MKKLIAAEYGPARPATSAKIWSLVHTPWIDGLLATLVVWAVATVQPVLAINTYQGIPLLDAGGGSTALSLTKVGAGTLDLGVVGFQQNTDGTKGAMYWGIAVDPSDPSGNTVYATQLPKPPGWSAEAMGLAFIGDDPDDPIIVGVQCGTLIEYRIFGSRFCGDEM